MLGGLVGASVFQADFGVLAKRHEVGEEKAVSRLDFVFSAHSASGVTTAGRLAGERQRHIAAAPVIAAAAPFFRACALCLRRLAVVKEEARVPFQGTEIRAVRKYKGCSHEMPRPIASAFHGA